MMDREKKLSRSLPDYLSEMKISVPEVDRTEAIFQKQA